METNDMEKLEGQNFSSPENAPEEQPVPAASDNTSSGDNDGGDTASVPAATQPRRRGRPPKNPDAASDVPAAPKRPRGRPRKIAEDGSGDGVPARRIMFQRDDIAIPRPAPEEKASETPPPKSPPPSQTPQSESPLRKFFHRLVPSKSPMPQQSESVPASDDNAPGEDADATVPARETPDEPAEEKTVFTFEPSDEIEQKELSFEKSEPARAPSSSFEKDNSTATPAPAPSAESAPEKPAYNAPQQKPWEKPRASAPLPPWKKPWEKKDRLPFPPKPPKFSGGKFNAQGKFEKFRPNTNPKRNWGELANTDSAEEATLSLGVAYDYNLLNDEAYLGEISALSRHVSKYAEVPDTLLPAKVASVVAPSEPPGDSSAPVAVENSVATASASSSENVPERPKLEPDSPAEPIDFNAIYESSMSALIATAKQFNVPVFRNPVRRPLVKKILRNAFAQRRPITIRGTLELLADGNGLLLYACDSYRVKELSAFVPQLLIKKFGLQRGHDIEAIAHPPMKGETAPIVAEITSIMGGDPATVKDLTPFTELTPYYPTRRIILESDDSVERNNLSMRCVDLLCPIGLGQRGLIVAPPRTGKTVLLQTIANAVARSVPEAHLIVLLVDERPEEVTDFKRKTAHGEVIASTFDETAENHVHVAEMVIERARRMVESGKDVVILLDSITRLARAYNTLMPNGGKILSGGVEAGALSKPKRFFGSARNIEGGGSLTILGTALIDTGSKMDEVIFEEFKGTGNMELDLDRDLANKRIFPAINFERSGTRKEELLYHPQEMQCVYAMRRAMKGVPSLEAMEMLISRIKKTKTNAEFLVTLASR